MESLFRVGCVACAISSLVSGCASSKASNTARTATEQMLISNAVDQALNKVDFRPFNGHTVYLNDKYVDCVDKAYVISSVRHRILGAGALLVEDPARADVHVELRSGTVGTDTADSFIGVPEITLPGMLTLPEVRLLTRSSQKGIAKLGLVAIDARTQQVLGSGGMSLAESDTRQWYVMGVGPFRSGSIHGEMADGTTGPAAQMRNWVPQTVAFNSPPTIEGKGDERQYASNAQSEAKPVNFEAPAAPPAVEAADHRPPRRLAGE